MWTTLALLSALHMPVGQANGKLSLDKVRSTYGVLGLDRPDNKILPGDSFVISFEIHGIKADDSGRVKYSVGMEVLDSRGKEIFKQDPRDLEASASLGGNSLPAFAMINVGLDQPEGTYSVKVTVTDRASNQKASVTKEYEILPKSFGLVRFTTTLDAEGKLAAPHVGAGQALWINFATVEFARDQSTHQPDLTVKLSILDEKGNPTLAKPFVGEVNKDIAAKALDIPLQFMIELNRSGSFKIEITLTDNKSKKETKLTVPLKVL